MSTVRTLPNEGILCGAIISIITAVVGPQIWVRCRRCTAAGFACVHGMAWHGMASTYTIVQQRMCSLTQCCRGTAAALRIDRWGATLQRCLGCTATLKAAQRAVWRLVQLTELFTVSGVTVLAQDVLLFLFSLSFVFSVGTNLSRVYRELQKRRPIEFRASDCRQMANAPLALSP